jgi:hypothetical protein
VRSKEKALEIKTKENSIPAGLPCGKKRACLLIKGKRGLCTGYENNIDRELLIGYPGGQVNLRPDKR